MRSNEKIVRANGVDLCVESFGDPAHPAILLVMGAGASRTNHFVIDGGEGWRERLGEIARP